jgi:prepilin-type N-terminal cleavage/methylation domain-containing protein
MQTERKALGKGNAGFSLMEIVIVCVLIGIIAAVIIPPLHQGVQSFAVTEARGDLTSQARQAATRMIRELRNIQKEADNTPNISTANATIITFVDVLDNTITFCLWASGSCSPTGNTVQRNSNPLVAQVSSLQFRYFNGSNAELTTLPLSATDRNNVRRIMVTLTLAEGSLTVSVTEQAYLRELSG